MDELLTYQEVAEYLKIEVEAVRKLVRRGLIPAVRFSSRLVRFRRSDIERAMEEKLDIKTNN